MPLDMWASGRPYFGKAPAWVIDQDDQARLQTYELYENIYRNNPGTFKLMQRGQDAAPVYLLSPRKIIETTHRFLAVNWDYIVNPKIGTPDDQAVIKALLQKTFVRELMYSKFTTQKRWGLIRGDTVWHIIGDDTKPEGSRISIHELNPGNYFPILDENDINRVVGCHITDIIFDPDDPNKSKTVARRQTYRKTENGTITTELGYFETDKWDDRNLPPDKIKRLKVLIEEQELPPEITSLPVYHLANSRMGGFAYGTSQLQGIERIFGAVNQSISDEELTLAMQGLGLYVTTAGPPEDENGDEGPWNLGPGQVVELPGADDKFERINGVSSVAPMLDHMKFILDETMSSVGIPDIASGRVDVAIAESGISLAFQMGPLIAANSEKEQDMLGKYDHMLYDLVHGWFPAYEGTPSDIAVEVASVVGDPLPQNRQAEINEILSLVQANLLSIAEARTRLIRLGYDLPADEESGQAESETVILEQKALAEAQNSDPFANRYNSELDNLDGKSGVNTGANSNGNGVTSVVLRS